MANLNAEIREVPGKKASALRADGFIPAELYGSGVENIHLSVNAKEFKKALTDAGESTIVNLSVKDAVHPVLIHDYQKNSITGEFLSVDFHKVNMSEKITTDVPLTFVGESSAVKSLGGILVRSMDEVEVEAFPADLPHELTIDISSLDELGKSLYVKDIVISGKFEITVDPETVIATVTAPEEEVVEVAPASVADVKTEGEVKRAEKEAKKAEAEE